MAILTCPSPVEIKPLIGSGNYQFTVSKFPDIGFMVQEVELPRINLGAAIMPTSVNDIPIPGETLEFAQLNVTFTVDEKLKNYMVLNDWMFSMGFPSDHKMYRELMDRQSTKLSLNELMNGYTDATLTILGNNNRAIAQAFFADAFPIALSGLRFASTNSEASPVTADVTFLYSYYTLKTAT